METVIPKSIMQNLIMIDLIRKDLTIQENGMMRLT